MPTSKSINLCELQTVIYCCKNVLIIILKSMIKYNGNCILFNHSTIVFIILLY